MAYSKFPVDSRKTTKKGKLPKYPDVQFRKLPFYDIMGEVLKPSSLVPRRKTEWPDADFEFYFTPKEAEDISMSRNLTGNKNEHGIQVQLRFCLLETSCPQNDEFPLDVRVWVNHKEVQLPKATVKGGVEARRPGGPVDITSLCDVSLYVNKMVIAWEEKYGKNYCVAVFLVRMLNSDILLQRLKQGGIRHPDYTRALIKEKLANDPESEIATTSLRISLLCPLGKMRMTIPCRANTCQHIQCFDAPNYLRMNERRATWICPLCDKPAKFYNLMIDGLFTELIKENLVDDALEIQFSKDGEWTPMRKNKFNNKNPPDASPVAQISHVSRETKAHIDVIDLTEGETSLKCLSIRGTRGSAGSDTTGRYDDVIDLTDDGETDTSVMSDMSVSVNDSSNSGSCSGISPNQHP